MHHNIIHKTTVTLYNSTAIHSVSVLKDSPHFRLLKHAHTPTS